ncbi:MAG: T9SS type A sorting domain-containing protein [Bacteroidales bacterium]|nr:T9SS type A sorting domain-containing protein [Bacteroidales bacterium]
MKSLITSVGLFLASICFAGNVVAQSQWREIATETAINNNAESRISIESVEIYSKDGHIIVQLPHKAQVKVFTILGQLVSQAELNSGTSMLKMNSRGIYIVKVGNVTQKVAI